MSKRAVLYARVSTDEQADKGYSLPSQLEAMRKYAEAQGFSVVGEFKDDYTGTVPIELRPEGRKAYELLKSGQADALIAYTVDRLVRPPEEGDEWEMPLLIRGLAKLGKELHTVNRGKLETSFAGLLIAMLDAKSAGDERRKIIERTTRGNNSKAKSGKVVGGGKAPYGYTFVRDNHQQVRGLEVVQVECEIVRLVYHWYVYGAEDNKPMTAWAIARRLSEMRVPTPEKRKTNGERPLGRPARSQRSTHERTPHLWNWVSINRILQNETYAGMWRFGKRIGKNGRGGRRPVGEQITVSVPAIIERTLWQAAQDRRAFNKKMSMRNCKHSYLLRGMVTCGECGGSFAGSSSKPDGVSYFYYRCSRHHFEGLEARRCHQTVIPAECLESVIWDYVLGLWSNKRRFEQALRAAQKAEEDATQPMRARLAAIDGLIAECLREADDLAYAMKKARGLVGDKLQREMDEVNTRHATLCGERGELAAKLKAQVLSEATIDELMKSRGDTIIGLHAATSEDKRRILENLRTEVAVKDGYALVTSRVAVSAPIAIDKNTPWGAFARSG